MTFSLAARCPQTGMLGGVVTTSSPAVGSRCLHARPQTGFVLTQFWTDPRLGPRALNLLAEGLPPTHVADAIAASTPDLEYRQFAILGATSGATFVHGARVKPAMAGATGPNSIAIGNILANDAIPVAMIEAFESSTLSFPERLLAALDAGEAAGGEGRPLVSAALLVAWQAPFPYVDLRVDAAANPLQELRTVWQAYAPFIDTYPARALNPRDQPWTP